MAKKQTIVLGVSGGIAAVKIPELVKLLTKQGPDVYVVLTQSAKNFVNLTQLKKATGHKVYVDLFEPGFDPGKVLRARKVEHIDLADKADLVLIVPATANLLAKLANGLADDFLTTMVLATQAPVIICPAMNSSMWLHPAVAANLARLRQLSYEIINPASGMLACGYEGLGRLEELEKIVSRVVSRLKLADSLPGKKILVTSGGTREPIDEVRFIGNRSSGKMGAAIAEACYLRGAKVLLLAAKDSVNPRFPIKTKTFTTGKDLLVLVRQYAPANEIMFHTAAVGDFSPVAEPGKLSSRRPVSLRLETQIKILEQVKKINPKICLIGFKAEYGLPPRLTVQPGADATIYNDVSRRDIGFGSEDNELVAVLPRETRPFKKAPKASVAALLVDYLGRYYHW